MDAANEGKKPADVGGAGNQHNDWGHSDVGAGNRQSESRLDDVTGEPGEEAGEIDSGLGGIGSLSTGNAGSRQSVEEDKPRK